MNDTTDKMLTEILSARNICSYQEFSSQAFSRNLGLISKAEQLALSQTRVGIPGLGGVGGVHLITLARTGIGSFVIADFDTFAIENTNRQFGARVPDYGKSKTEVMTREAKSINPFLTIQTFPQGLSPETVDSFLDEVDIVVDSLDFFAFDIRRLLFNRARELGKHVITAGPIGFSCALLVFSPNSGLSFDEYFAITEDMTVAQKTLHFQIGLTPRLKYFSYFDLSVLSHEAQKGPSLGLATQLCSAMAATEVVRITLKRGSVKAVPHYAQFDPYLRKYFRGHMPFGNRNPLQRFKIILADRLLNNQQMPPSRRPEINPQQDAFELVMKAAIQAPSGDNTQPWNLKRNGEKLNIYLDENADTSRFNVQQRAALISVGALLENMRIAAAHAGKKLVKTEFPDGTECSHIACCSISDCTETHDSTLYSALWRRSTNRKMYKKQPLLNTTEHLLRESLNEFSDVKLHLLTRKKDLKQLRGALKVADRVRSESQQDHEFLYNKIRFTRSEANQQPNGFPLKNLEAGFAGELMLRATQRWSVMSALNKLGMSSVVAEIASKGILHCSAAGLITVESNSKQAFLTGGQALQRFWLTATDLGLSFQPMTAITFYNLRHKLLGEQGLTPGESAELESAWQTLESVFSDFSWDRETPIMLFRIGFAAAPTEHTRRKPLHTFLSS